MNTAAIPEQHVDLADGRSLGYAEYGVPQGSPVIVFLGSAARGLRPPDHITAAHKVRLLTVERPGIGLSSFQPRRTLLDWPDDVVQLADALGIERFAVLGASQGGPYAAACAYKIPQRLTAVSLVSSPAPFEVPGLMHDMARPLRLVPIIAQRLPQLLVWSQAIMASPARRSPRWFVRQAFRNLPAVDQQLLASQGELEPMFVANLPEIYRQGGRGVAEELLVVSRPWGFDLAEIQATVYVWQGERDPNIPPAMGRYLARTIPGATATFVPEAGHFLTFSHWNQILAQLVT